MKCPIETLEHLCKSPLPQKSVPFAGLGAGLAAVALGSALVRRSLVARQLRLAGQDSP